MILLLIIILLPAASAVKYFNECGDRHLDIRYANCNHHLEKEIVHDTLYHITKIWFHEIVPMTNIDSWLMYGALLGWTLNKELLPWDDDIDVNIKFDQISAILPYNQTLWSSGPYTFLFDINRYIYQRRDLDNIIDARLICKENGLYLDMISLEKNNKNLYKGKDFWNQFSEDLLFPLSKDIFFKNININIPNNPKEIIRKKYKFFTIPKQHKNWSLDSENQWVLK